MVSKAARTHLDDSPRSGLSRPLIIVAGLSFGPVVALGLARFAYSLLLPAMRSNLHWTFAQAGTMNTANAVGYLVGAIAAGPLVARVGCRRPYLIGLVLTGLALLTSGASASFEVLLVLRLVAGATGAVVFIAGAGLVSRLIAELAPGRSSVLLGVYFAGGGLGIVISAVVVPVALHLGTGGSWRWGWIVLGITSLVVLTGALPAALRASEPPVDPGQRVMGWPLKRLAPTIASYALFGAGYIGYVTFIVAFLKVDGVRPGVISGFWAVLGATSVVAAFAWGPALGRLQGGRGPATVLAMLTVGAVLPLIFPSALGAFASALAFGGSFLAVVTAVTNLARRSLTPAQVAPAIAVLTVAFGIGQSLGPVLAGILSDGPNGVRSGLELSVALLAAAAMVALIQRRTPDQDLT
ncbi:MAG: MFS transporter [Acidimicrobiales bacterium]|nr:MAG: MFS transporter [Acidimicrobiales bacterium]